MSTEAQAETKETPRLEPRLAKRVVKHVPPRLRPILSLDDFEDAARRYLPHPIFAYVSGSVEMGLSFAANRRDFMEMGLVPRILADCAQRSQKRTLMGVEYDHPFGISPMGLSALSAYDGDVVLGKVAKERKIPGVLSATSLTRLERVASEAGSRWFQAYLPGIDERIEAMVDRVGAAGFDTIVLTVDVPVSGNRENNVRAGFESPLKPSLRLAVQGIVRPHWLIGTFGRTLKNFGMPHFENMDVTRGPAIVSKNVVRSMAGRDGLAWRHAELIRKRWPGKFVLKGVLAAEDARLAREMGCDGIVVSNHGGRQLDSAISPIAALLDIKPVAGDMAVMVESGIRRGGDVLKALALGADFVFVGRPFLFGATIAGEDGVRHAVDILSSEIDRNMTLLGVRTLSELNPDFVRLPPHLCPRG
ncbi:alpha-hydroxy acid oxidase [Acuticoccus mangrovi]|uniref:Alpha-hydroxy-acid oxidizing protein n=1 Tax=Acuticoccus mangrovi TaxID=2796142 RepID=A0A934IJG2_9HYPH|nr:alpha-hydroxy acid oxidase [Acuticoccus mangrovi]MBJ3774872.1 alpha-hydroxy-acid oxidizing protein [Acuticoccus mangrovi]